MSDGLRSYPEYKSTGVDWIGDIPARWRLKPIFGEYKENQVKNTGMAETRVLSLSYGRIIVKPPEKLHGLVPESFETYQIIEPGDIIIRPTDLQNDHTSLRIGLSEHHGIITSAYMCLRTWNDLSPNYGYHVLNVFDLTKAIYAYGSGLRQNLNFEHIKRVKVPVPPPDEQEAIVRFLDVAESHIRRYIRAKQKLIKLLNEQKQAIIQQAVTRGLDPTVPVKDSGVEWLGEIPAHWKILPLKYLSTVQSGLTLGKNYTIETQEYPYLRVANVQAGYVDLTTVKKVSIPLNEAQGCMLQSGDVLMTEGGDPDKLGRGTVWNGQIEPCLHQNHIFAVRPNQNILKPHFLQTLLSMKYAQVYFIRSAKQTTNLASTNKTTIGQLPVLLPPLEEQDSLIRDCQSKSELIARTLETTTKDIAFIQEYRTRLIADVVTGKVDVRGIAFALPEEFEDTDSLSDADYEDEVFDELELEEVSDAD